MRRKLNLYLTLLFSVMLTCVMTACSSSDNEPATPQLADTAWSLYRVDFHDYETGCNDTEDFDHEAILVIRKDNTATLYTLENDFEPINYNVVITGHNITLTSTDPHTAFVTLEGVWEIKAGDLIMTYDLIDEDGQERCTDYYNQIPYNEYGVWLQSFKDYQADNK